MLHLQRNDFNGHEKQSILTLAENNPGLALDL
jgi:hypothetical protein